MIFDSAGNSTASYNIVYSPKTGASDYKVDVSGRNNASTPAASGILWMAPDGTVIAFDTADQNLSGAQAFNSASGMLFNIEFGMNREMILLPLYQSFIHVTTQTTISIGATSVAVTNFAANSLPFTAGQCQNGFTQNITSLVFKEGQVAGTTFSFLPLVSFVGTETLYGNQGNSGQTFNVNQYIQITSITKA